MNVLVDTSVWSLAFRRKPEDLNAVEKSLVQELRQLGPKKIVPNCLDWCARKSFPASRVTHQFEKLRLGSTSVPGRAPEYRRL